MKGAIGQSAPLLKANLGNQPPKLDSPTKPTSLRPRRLARPRTPPFHGDNTGSNPVGDANKMSRLRACRATTRNIGDATKKTYIRHSETFVRWLEADVVPGGRKK